MAEEIVVDNLDDLTMEDFAKWIESEKSGDVRASWPFLARMVVVWPFDGDPTDPQSYGKLSLRQYRLVNQAVSARVQAYSKN